MRRPGAGGRLHAVMAARNAPFGVLARALALLMAAIVSLAACGTAVVPGGRVDGQTPIGSAPTALGSWSTTGPTESRTARPAAPAALAEREFWSVIASTRTSRSTAERARLLQGRLRTMAPTKIAAFDRQLTAEVDAIGKPAQLGAAEIMMGFTSANAFVDFRAWVVAQGQQVHDAFRDDPDSLVDAGFDREGELVAGELIASAPEQAYRTVTGRTMEEDFPDLPQPHLIGSSPDGPSYTQLAADLPRLAEVYLPQPVPAGNAFRDGPRGVEPRR